MAHKEDAAEHARLQCEAEEWDEPCSLCEKGEWPKNAMSCPECDAEIPDNIDDALAAQRLEDQP